MTALTYRRLSTTPPPIREQLILGPEGGLVAWRSNGPEVGRFRGSAADARALASLAGRALGMPPPSSGTVAPDAPFEIVELGDVTVSVGVDADLGAPWQPLLTACRELIEHPGTPLATVALVVDAPNGVRLEHRGTDPLRIGLGALVATAAAYRDGAEVVTASARLRAGVVEAGPGWSIPIGLDHRDADVGGTVFSVAFNLDDEGVWIPVRCTVVAPTPGNRTPITG